MSLGRPWAQRGWSRVLPPGLCDRRGGARSPQATQVLTEASFPSGHQRDGANRAARLAERDALRDRRLQIRRDLSTRGPSPGPSARCSVPGKLPALWPPAPRGRGLWPDPLTRLGRSRGGRLILRQPGHVASCACSSGEHLGHPPETQSQEPARTCPPPAPRLPLPDVSAALQLQGPGNLVPAARS